RGAVTRISPSALTFSDALNAPSQRSLLLRNGVHAKMLAGPCCALRFIIAYNKSPPELVDKAILVLKKALDTSMGATASMDSCKAAWYRQPKDFASCSQLRPLTCSPFF